jgi:oxalate decarboxylase/phosphoglucose isomerase-like protein (cupin superfamily)
LNFFADKSLWEDSMNRYFIEPDDVETIVFDWGTIKWTSAPKVSGSKRFSAGIVLMNPGKGHDTHNHPGCEEILYCISGCGKQTVAGQEKELKPGMTIFIPPDISHSTINTGWEPLKILVVFDPPGPEEFQKTLPDCKVIPAGKLP